MAFSMLSCIIYPCMFGTIVPMFLGLLLENKRAIAVFGMVVGVGEIVGSLVSGRMVGKLGPKISAGVVFLLASAALALSAVIFPLTHQSVPRLQPTMATVLPLAFLLGAGDSCNGVLLTTLVGRVYKSASQAGFAMYCLVFNVGCTVVYQVTSYLSFGAVLILMGGLVMVGTVGVVTLREKDIQAEKEVGGFDSEASGESF